MSDSNRIFDRPLDVPSAGIRSRDCVALPKVWDQPPGYYAAYAITQDIDDVWIYVATAERVDDELNVVSFAARHG